MNSRRIALLLLSVLWLSPLSRAPAQTTAVAAGTWQSWAVGGTGVASWGMATNGLLVNGAPSATPVPTPAATLASVGRIEVGLVHAVALDQGGTVLSWGANHSGQLGLGTQSASSFVPSTVINLTNVVDVDAGWSWSLAVRGDGSVWGWGFSAESSLTVPVPAVLSTPTQIGSFFNAVDAACGDRHGLVVVDTGVVWSWGRNTFGSLGLGTVGVAVAAPSPVATITSAVAVAAGSDHSLALDASGNVWAWGRNQRGQLGNGTTTPVFSSPALVAGLQNVVAIDAFGDHGLAVRADGTVWFWGQAFDPALPAVTTPAQVSIPEAVVAVAIGENHALAIGASGGIWAWGGNHHGQLGNGNRCHRNQFCGASPPIRVMGFGPQVPTALSVGTACVAPSGFDPRLWSGSMPGVGELGFAVTVSRVNPSRPTLLFGAAGPAQPAIQVNGCNVYLELTSLFSLAASGIVPWGPVTPTPLGDATFPLPIPPDPALGGTLFTLQAAVLETSTVQPLTTTNALELRLN